MLVKGHSSLSNLVDCQVSRRLMLPLAPHNTRQAKVTDKDNFNVEMS
jgi:hypothetical protein